MGHSLPVPSANREISKSAHMHSPGETNGTYQKSITALLQHALRWEINTDIQTPFTEPRSSHELIFGSTRRSSPSAFQRPSLGYDESNQGASPYTSTERVDHGLQDYRFQQDGPRPGNQGTPSNQGFAALDALATSATARRSDSIQVPLRQPTLANRSFPIISRPTSIRLFKTYFSTIHPMWPILVLNSPILVLD